MKVPKSKEAGIKERRNLISQYLRQKMSYDDMLEALKDHPHIRVKMPGAYFPDRVEVTEKTELFIF